MKFKIYKSLVLFSFIALAACTDFEEMNTDPYNPPYAPGESATDVNPEGIDLDYELSEEDIKKLSDSEASIGSLFRSFTYEGLYNDYQITTNLTHDIYAGYMANSSTSFHESSPTYVYRDGWSASRWKHFYDNRTAQEYAQLVKIFHFVNPEKYVNEFYVTRIYYAFLISMQTDTYGDIPLSYYIKGVLPPDQNVTYDSQEKVYDMMFKMLDQAIRQIDPSKGLNLGEDKGSNDRCFAGDINKWLRFANTLRLRLALRISNVDPDRAQEEGEAALKNQYGLMASNADNMRTVPKYASVEAGGEGDTGSENIHALIFSWGDGMLMSKDMEEAYKKQSGVLDPRCEILWWRPSPYTDLTQGIESNKDFAGCRIGDPEIFGSKSTEEYSAPRTNLVTAKNRVPDPKHWFSYDRELVWLGYAESRFLLAEAALRGWRGDNLTADAETYFIEGIKASMQYYEIDGGKTNEYINGLFYQNSNPFRSGNREAALEEIITQKWIAVFPNGNEGWAEFRRTDYPALYNIVENNSDGDVAEGKFIKRIKYPESESQNPNRPKGDYQGTKVWWDVADTNNETGERIVPNNFRSSSTLKVFK